MSIRLNQVDYRVVHVCYIAIAVTALGWLNHWDVIIDSVNDLWSIHFLDFKTIQANVHAAVQPLNQTPVDLVIQQTLINCLVLGPEISLGRSSIAVIREKEVLLSGNRA